MRLPWSNRTGLAKAVAILSTVLIVSLGLCGVNFVATVGLVGVDAPRRSAWSPVQLMIDIGFVELAAIACSFVGLLVVGILFLFRNKNAPPSPIRDEKEDE
jgi:hypothetical protein